MVDYEVICEEIKCNGLEDTLLKYNCSLNELFKYCLHKGSYITRRKGESSSTIRYIQEQGDGCYRIRKSVKGKLIYFGYYDSLEDAILVRDRLMELGWNKLKLRSVCDELGVEYKKSRG